MFQVISFRKLSLRDCNSRFFRYSLFDRMRGWVLGLLSGAFGLYEDQIGKFDWRREMIGYPKLVDFEQVKGPSEYITVYTNLGILASISARDGKVFKISI